jgi:MAP/microtubule affinity-regulating kinase
MAPELVRKAEYDGRQVDMWALGVLLFALLSGIFPFKGQSEKELYGKIQKS